MMVPRSYLYTEEKRKLDMAALHIPRTRSTSPALARKRSFSSRELDKSRNDRPSPPRSIPAPERTTSEPVTIPIAPMLVRPRSESQGRSPSPNAQENRPRGSVRARRKASEKHDANALPPAVAALLAVTAIPPPTSLQRQRRPRTWKHMSIDELVYEWKQDCSPTSGSPLDALLEPYEDTETDQDSIFDEEKEVGVLSSRSVSNDSIVSMASFAPSLDATQSTVSTNLSVPSTPPTPAYRTRKLSIRTDKLVASPPTEACPYDHPLRPLTPTESPVSPAPSFPVRQKRAIKPKSTFKSNLTASIAALKTAARSFSNFTAPSLPQDDLLSRSLFSQPYPAEMRPKSSEGVPDPALRRYLNPTTHATPPRQPHISSDQFSLQLQEALSQPLRDDQDAPSIQMQTYSSRRGRKTVRARAGMGVEAAMLALDPQQTPTTRQREPRENADFLRVIVCEMNMRRSGKLDAKTAFRARIWLPPRKAEVLRSLEGDGEADVGGCGARTVVPRRWIGVGPDDL